MSCLNTSPEVSPPRFRDAFARKTGVDPVGFERQMFVRCVPPLHRPVARLLLWLRPGLFDLDFATLGEVANATTADEVCRIAGDLRGGYRNQSNVVRDWLGVRASGRRLTAIAREVLT